jgi:hypothetical protein
VGDGFIGHLSGCENAAPPEDQRDAEGGLAEGRPGRGVGSGIRAGLEVEGIGKGWSSPVVTEDMIYISGMIDSKDQLSAVDFNAIWVPACKYYSSTVSPGRCQSHLEWSFLDLIRGILVRLNGTS